ncbi:MAG: riboflavin biosynthesis protein RibF [Clostridia bacterium]|nr:riboflavin biosynthesis protein RibF [Clostridia bacterium]
MKLLTHETQWRGGETVIAFGMFDGVHLGHAKLMRTAAELARENALTSVVYTFSSHPMATYAPEHVPPQLGTRPERIAAVARMGIDVAVFRPFDGDYAAQTPEQFVQAFCEALHPRHVVIGFNYSFGARGAGKAQDMIRLGERFGFKTHVVAPVELFGETVSSTRVRSAITAGDLELTEALLGRPYVLSGVIRHGKQLGRRLDFPTANLAFPTGKALPPRGVYAALAEVKGRVYMAAVNVGEHPTAPGGAPAIEANLLDYEGGEIYGYHMRLRFYWRLRGEKRFDSLDALRSEVLANREQVRSYLTRRDLAPQMAKNAIGSEKN